MYQKRNRISLSIKCWQVSVLDVLHMPFAGNGLGNCGQHHDQWLEVEQVPWCVYGCPLHRLHRHLCAHWRTSACRLTDELVKPSDLDWALAARHAPMRPACHKRPKYLKLLMHPALAEMNQTIAFAGFYPPHTHTVAVCTASVLCCFHTNQTYCSVILLRRWRRFMKILICSDCVLQPHLYTEVHYFTCWTFTSTFEQCSKPLLVDDYRHYIGTILSNTHTHICIYIYII